MSLLRVGGAAGSWCGANRLPTCLPPGVAQLRETYRARLGIAVACLAALLFTAAWFALSFRQSQHEGRVW